MYLDSSSKHAYHEEWLVDSGASFHMTPHREWFFKYERYDGGDESKTKIIGQGKFKLNLMDGRIRTLPSVLHIPRLAKILIFVRKMDYGGVKKIFEKETCRMVQGEMVLLKRVHIGTLYKMLGSTM
jgi:hypothetical protein